MNPIADYMTAGTELPAYLPYPRFLLETDLSHTARELYSLLLDRSTLSQKNGWQDSEGRVYIVYPIAEIAEVMKKGSTTIKGGTERTGRCGAVGAQAGGFFLCQPSVCESACPSGTVSRPTDGRKTDPHRGRKPTH